MAVVAVNRGSTLTPAHPYLIFDNPVRVRPIRNLLPRRLGLPSRSLGLSGFALSLTLFHPSHFLTESSGSKHFPLTSKTPFFMPYFFCQGHVDLPSIVVQVHAAPRNLPSNPRSCHRSNCMAEPRYGHALVASCSEHPLLYIGSTTPLSYVLFFASGLKLTALHSTAPFFTLDRFACSSPQFTMHPCSGPVLKRPHFLSSSSLCKSDRKSVV